MGETDRVDEDDGQDLLERDGDHGEVVAAQPQRGKPQPGARRAGERHAPEEAEPKGHVIV
jgi:hypothetical protein